MKTISICLNDGGRSQSRRPKQKSDCTVIATAIAFKMLYDDAFDIMNIHGRTNNKGIVYNTFLKTIPEYCVRVGGNIDTAKLAIEMFSQGTYLFTVRGHVYCVIDGVIQDTYPWNCFDYVYDVWKVIKPMSFGDLLL